MPRVMTPEGQAMLDAYPPFLHGDQTLRAVCNALGPEFAELNRQVDRLRDGQTPTTADDAFLALVEAELGLPVRPAGMSLEDRRTTVLGFLARLTMGGTGLNWGRVASLVLGTGWSYTVGGTNNSILTVSLPYAATSARGQIAAVFLRSIMPATMQLVLTFGSAFVMDHSKLDEGTLA